MTQEDIERRERRIARAEELGLSFTRIKEDTEYENPYHVRAIRHILADEEIPEDVMKHLKKTK